MTIIIVSAEIDLKNLEGIPFMVLSEEKTSNFIRNLDSKELDKLIKRLIKSQESNEIVLLLMDDRLAEVLLKIQTNDVFAWIFEK